MKKAILMKSIIKNKHIENTDLKHKLIHLQKKYKEL